MPCCRGDALAGAVLSSTELPEKEVGKCSCAGFMVFPLTKSAFASIEPKSQSGSIRTSCPASSSARAAFARRGDPQPGDGACRGSLVDSDSELGVNTHGGDATVLAEREGARAR
jgi:hypothetical protein